MGLKKGNIAKYTTFCTEINGDGAIKSKKSFNIFLTKYIGLFISPSVISELDCATTMTDTVERSISIDRDFLPSFFFLY